MEIPPPQRTSFPFIPLIPKQALRVEGPGSDAFWGPDTEQQSHIDEMLPRIEIEKKIQPLRSNASRGPG
jgi:hypothetical protein